MILHRIVNKIIALGKKHDHIAYARWLGVSVGENCKFVDNPNWGSEPYLIKVGNHVLISGEVVFSNHDGATWVFRETEQYKDTFKFGRITIGNNCFIGHRSILLPNVKIGDNAVIAAGSVVNKSIPSNEVWGGVPAHFIMKTEEFAKKCYERRIPFNGNNLKRNKKDELLRMLSLEEQDD